MCTKMVQLTCTKLVRILSDVTIEDGKGSNPDSIIGGFIRSRSDTPGVVKVEIPRSDELTYTTDECLDLVQVRKRRKARSIKLAVMGMSSAIINKGDPRYKSCITLANKYRRTRARELSELHGHVSVGASALLASASLALAASRFLYEKYAEDGGGTLGTNMLKQAASMADSARQSELAAWEMSAREGLAKRRQASQEGGTPWISSVDGDAKRSGRKTNAERQEKFNASIITEDGKEVRLPDARED